MARCSAESRTQRIASGRRTATGVADACGATAAAAGGVAWGGVTGVGAGAALWHAAARATAKTSDQWRVMCTSSHHSPPEHRRHEKQMQKPPTSRQTHERAVQGPGKQHMLLSNEVAADGP